MTPQEVRTLITPGRLPSKGPVQWIETHANWVLLTPEFAYKIKRPVHFSFMDYSTLERRQHFCEQEVALNSRFSKDVYLGVLPVRETETGFQIGQDEGTIVDYAVHMRRLDNKRQMSVLMDKNEVSAQQVQAIAQQVAAFHQTAEVISAPMEASILFDIFADIEHVFPWALDHLEDKEAIVEMQSNTTATRFLLQNLQPRLQERISAGWVVDGHGDLHTGNIFLLDQPVLFDCIEFNDGFRRLDVLDEIAFLCMDLDSYGAESLKQAFLKAYFDSYPCAPDPLDQPLFWYYQAYRANVRFKVTALRAMQAEGTPASVDFEEMAIYARLFNAYFERIRKNHGYLLEEKGS
jgi:aminoglycoside phosphotransferase family enzyme